MSDYQKFLASHYFFQGEIDFEANVMFENNPILAPLYQFFIWLNVVKLLFVYITSFSFQKHPFWVSLVAFMIFIVFSVIQFLVRVLKEVFHSFLHPSLFDSSDVKRAKAVEEKAYERYEQGNLGGALTQYKMALLLYKKLSLTKKLQSLIRCVGHTLQALKMIVTPKTHQ
jgi:hypothetical protein